MVEHDEETIRAADTIIDMGPGAGRHGGRLVAAGNLEKIQNTPASITGACLDGHPRVISSRLRPCRRQKAIIVKGARANNLKHIDVRIPLERLVCVTGVSGSGKSSLVKTTVYHEIRRRLRKKSDLGAYCKDVQNWPSITRIQEVDHSPIGRTPRSVPASYVGFLTDMRNLMAQTAEARVRGYSASRFSFNVKAGRCPQCKGQGRPKVGMAFLPDVTLVAYIVMSVVKAALGSVHGVDFIEKHVSGYYVANEIKGVYQGMMIVVSNEHWFVFRDMPVGDLVRLLKKLAKKVKLRKYQKHPRGPKKPQPKRVFMKNKPHVSTARILAERKK